MCCWRNSFLLKMYPKYLNVFLGQRIRPPIEERSSREGSKILCNLEKWNTFVFPCSTLVQIFLKETKWFDNDKKIKNLKQTMIFSGPQKDHCPYIKEYKLENLWYLDLHCFSHFSRHLVIFTSSVFSVNFRVVVSKLWYF